MCLNIRVSSGRVIGEGTLGADDDDRDVRAVCAELAVELVELLEAGFILQAEDHDHCVDPAAERCVGGSSFLPDQ